MVIFCSYQKDGYHSPSVFMTEHPSTPQSIDKRKNWFNMIHMPEGQILSVAKVDSFSCQSIFACHVFCQSLFADDLFFPDNILPFTFCCSYTD